MSVITKFLQNGEKVSSYYLNWPANEKLYQTSKYWNDLVRLNIALEPDQINKIIILKVETTKFNGLF